MFKSIRNLIVERKKQNKQQDVRLRRQKEKQLMSIYYRAA